MVSAGSRIAVLRLVAVASTATPLACVYDPVRLPPEVAQLDAAGARRGDPEDLDARAAADREVEPALDASGGASSTDASAADLPAADRAPSPDRGVDFLNNPTIAEDPPCTERMRLVPAIDGVSLDYGPPPRDAPQTDPLELSIGNGHNHVHDVTAWIKFALDGVPRGARLRRLRLLFTATISPAAPPPDIRIMHSPSDGWSFRSSDPAEVPRTTAVGGGSGPLLRGRQAVELDLAAYGPLWPEDLSDLFVTLGVAAANDRYGEFRHATIVSSVPGNSDGPAIELLTCESEPPDASATPAPNNPVTPEYPLALLPAR